MTEAEVRELLTFTADCYDTTLNPETVLATWTDGLDNAFVPNLSLDEARAAVIEHYRCTPVRITAGDILKRVRDDRASTAAHLVPSRYGVPPNEAYRQARADLEARVAAAKAPDTGEADEGQTARSLRKIFATWRNAQ